MVAANRNRWNPPVGTASRKPGNGLRHQGCASRVPCTLNGRPALSCLGALHGGPGARIISRSHPHQGKLPASATQAVNGKVLLFKPGTGGETDPPRESGVTATGGNLVGRDRQGIGKGPREPRGRLVRAADRVTGASASRKELLSGRNPRWFRNLRTLFQWALSGESAKSATCLQEL